MLQRAVSVAAPCVLLFPFSQYLSVWPCYLISLLCLLSIASVLTPHLGACLRISPLTWLKGLWVVLRWLSLSPVAASLQPLGEVRRSGAEGRGTGSGRSRTGRGRQGVRWLRPQGRGVVARRLAAAGTLAQRRCWGLGWGRRVGDGFGHVRGSNG